MWELSEQEPVIHLERSGGGCVSGSSGIIEGTVCVSGSLKVSNPEDEIQLNRELFGET